MSLRSISIAHAPRLRPMYPNPIPRELIDAPAVPPHPVPISSAPARPVSPQSTRFRRPQPPGFARDLRFHRHPFIGTRPVRGCRPDPRFHRHPKPSGAARNRFHRHRQPAIIPVHDFIGTRPVRNCPRSRISSAPAPARYHRDPDFIRHPLSRAIRFVSPQKRA